MILIGWSGVQPLRGIKSPGCKPNISAFPNGQHNGQESWAEDFINQPFGPMHFQMAQHNDRPCRFAPYT